MQYPPVRTALFDLDGCLYPAENGLEEHCRGRIFSFMVNHLGVATLSLARELWTVLFRQYNQSLRGLRAAGYTFDEDVYWRYIRDEASLSLLAPAPDVAALLRTLRAAGVACYVFTNCREREAREALAALAIPVELFDDVIGSDAMGGCCKPEAAAFERAVARSGCVPAATVMFEDSLKNLVQARALGMRTVLVGTTTALEEGGSIEGLTACVRECSLSELRACPAAAFLPLV